MVKQRNFLLSVVGLCFCLCSLSPAVVASTCVLEEDVAQGDGDPSEEVLLEETAQEARGDVDEDVATITAEGDFLVPTYLLPVAEDEKKSVSEMKDATSVVKTITTTTTTTTKEVPVYVVSNSSLKAQENVDNLEKKITDKVPVVDVHVSNGEVASDLVEVQQQEMPVVHNIGMGYNVSKTLASNDKKPKVSVVSTVSSASEILKKIPEPPVLIPLAPLAEVVEPEPIVEPHVRKVIPSKYADSVLMALEEKKYLDFIMPQEIKVSFYKNASHFSGQTIKWIKAFSIRAMNDPRLVVQVRLSTQAPAVQQKRLSIIQNTLVGNGLSPHQIQVIFTDRPADSLILRTALKPELAQVSGLNEKKGRRSQKRTMRW